MIFWENLKYFILANTTTNSSRVDAIAFFVCFVGLLCFIDCVMQIFTHLLQSTQPKTQQIIVAKGMSMRKIMEEINKSRGEIFEAMLCEMYEKLNYIVEMTPRSYDYGADLILYSLDGRQKIVVQVKRSSYTVGENAVQQVIAARAYYNATHAIVITNNEKFSKAARTLADATGVELIDRKGLALLIREAYKI